MPSVVFLTQLRPTKGDYGLCDYKVEKFAVIVYVQRKAILEKSNANFILNC